MNGQDYLDAAARLQSIDGLDPWTPLMRVLVGKLQGMNVPQPLRPALAQAASHWWGEPEDLLAEKAGVWRHLEAKQPSDAYLATPEGKTARALLCVLETAGDEEARSMTAEWFAAMADDQRAAGCARSSTDRAHSLTESGPSRDRCRLG